MTLAPAGGHQRACACPGLRREDTEIDRFRDGNRALYDSHMRSVRISAWYLPVIELPAWGRSRWRRLRRLLGPPGRVTVGTVAFFVLLANLFEPVQQLSQLFNTVQSAGAAHKLYELLDTTVDVDERPARSTCPAAATSTVEGVSFAYGGGPPVLAT